MENNMIVRIASAGLLALASATMSVPAQAVDIDVRIAPPAPRHEAMPGHRPGHVWTPGYWDWRGKRHVWVSGSWVRERPGYVYTRPTWVNDNGRWHLYRGAWARGDRDGDGIPNRYDNRNNRRGDRDRDGVPNRFDRDRDNDGVRNRNDRDRDGDGVPNRRDARPDNPNRR
jgi:hypothetical protein